MTETQRSHWNSPVVFLIVTAWALVVGAFFSIVDARFLGEPSIEFDPIFSIAFSFAFGIVGVVIGTLLDLAGRKTRQPLAHFNFGVAIVLAIFSLTIMSEAFGLVGRD